MYVYDPEIRIEYVGGGRLNLPPGAYCVAVVAGWTQEEDEDGFDTLAKPFRTECSVVEQNLVEFHHAAIQFQNPDRYCVVPDSFFFDRPNGTLELTWGNERRALPEGEHWHWFDIEGHDCGKIHCSYELEPSDGINVVASVKTDTTCPI